MQHKINFTEYLVKKIVSKRTLHYNMEVVNIFKGFYFIVDIMTVMFVKFQG